ncbi:CoA-binding protein [Oculatella sp. LEGE 06141]|uniref:succinate--CoA ligase subunit alpha n=1 Tax=Oculatella sp. LEGE 06141 TaxID=1828648 RepID=UPI0018805159|nr:CoA-binding protein [Oculatella sp. LEGE 06141]MBE9181862.1 CoA-binding protein [Oculatella sp. LEGE 06141]
MNFTSDSKILVQGIVEPLGALFAPLMQSYGTQVVAGVSPGHGGQKHQGIAVFDMVEQALSKTGTVDATVIFVDPYEVLDAALEAIAAGIRHIVIITAGVPPMDMVHLVRKAEATETLLVGPNSPGIIVPGQILLGIHPAEFYTPGSIGLISRSGTLTYEIARELTRAGFGQSIGVGIGGDRIVGSSFQQWLQILDEDEPTEAIVLVGEIGGDSEEVAAHYIAEAIDKPVVAYIAGRTAPKGQIMGHAGAIIASQIAGLGADIGTAESKMAAFKQAKIPVAKRPSDIPDLIKKALQPSKRKSQSGSRASKEKE